MKNTHTTPRTVIEVNHSNDTSTDINIFDWLDIISQGKWLIMSFMLICAFFAFSLGYLSMPKYNVTAMLYVDSASPSASGLAGTGIMPTAELAALTEAQILTSRTRILAIVNTMHLYIKASPHYFPLIGEGLARHYHSSSDDLFVNPLAWFMPELPSWMQAYAWGGERIKIKFFEVPHIWDNIPLTLTLLNDKNFNIQGEAGHILLTGKIGEKITSNGFSLWISELHGRVGSTFDLVYRSPLAVTQEWRDSLEVIETVRSSNILAVSKSTIEPKKTVSFINNLMALHVKEDIQFAALEAENGVNFIQSQLPDVRNKLNLSQQRWADYLSKQDEIDLESESSTVNGKIIVLDQKINELELQYTDLLHRFTPQHSIIKTMKDKIRYLKNERATLKKETDGLPEASQKSAMLQKNIGVASDLYTTLLSRSQELGIAKMSNTGNIRIIDWAVEPETSSSLGQVFMLLLGIIAGLLLGVLVVLARKLLNGGVEDPEEIKKLGLSIFTSIPHSKIQERLFKKMRLSKETDGNLDFLISVQNPKDLTVESLRSLRTSIQIFTMEKKATTIMITGASPSIGKSFISSNLSQLIKTSGNKVLLIDGDLRRGSLHHYLSLPSMPGLSDVLLDNASIDDALVCSEEKSSHVDFLPCGNFPDNPSELLSQPLFTNLLDKLQTMYDMILIDTPPVLAVTDALIIGKHVDVTLLVLRCSAHSKREIKQTLSQLSNANIIVEGGILNDVKATSTDNSGRYGYTYQYSYDK